MVDNRIVDAYFNHGDSWESFREWNALGAGMPVVMNEKEHVVQYYHVPSLSGIQIYGEDSPQISLATLPPTSTRAPIPSRLAAGDQPRSSCRKTPAAASAVDCHGIGRLVEFQKLVDGEQSPCPAFSFRDYRVLFWGGDVHKTNRFHDLVLT